MRKDHSTHSTSADQPRLPAPATDARLPSAARWPGGLAISSMPLDEWSLVRLFRGHGRKIAMAVSSLEGEGRLRPLLRPVERNKRVLDWLMTNGYGDCLPSRRALDRHWQFHTQSAQLAQLR